MLRNPFEMESELKINWFHNADSFGRESSNVTQKMQQFLFISCFAILQGRIRKTTCTE